MPMPGISFDFGLTAACQAIYTSDQVEYDRDFNPRDIDEFWVVNARLNQDIKLFEKSPQPCSWKSETCLMKIMKKAAVPIREEISWPGCSSAFN